MLLLETRGGEMPTALMAFSASGWKELEKLVDTGRIARDLGQVTEAQPIIPRTAITDYIVEVALSRSVVERTPDQVTVRWSGRQVQAVGATMFYGLLNQGISGGHFAPYDELKSVERQLLVIREA